MKSENSVYQFVLQYSLLDVSHHSIHINLVYVVVLVVEWELFWNRILNMRILILNWFNFTTNISAIFSSWEFDGSITVQKLIKYIFIEFQWISVATNKILFWYEFKQDEYGFWWKPIEAAFFCLFNSICVLFLLWADCFSTVYFWF